MRVTLVAPNLRRLPGQRSYLEALRRHLPPDIQTTVRQLGRVEVPLGRRRVGRTASAWASYPFVRTRGADLVHGTDTFCAVKGAGVLTVHDLIPMAVSREPAARLHARLFGARIRGAGRVVTPTQVWAERIEAMLRVPPDRIRVIPQGHDPAAFHPGLPRPAALGGGDGEGPEGEGRAGRGGRAGRDGRIVLLVGADRPYKRFAEVAAAVAGMEGVRAVHAGPPLSAAFRRRWPGVQDLGRVPEPELAALYGHADLLVYCSVEEGFGLPPLEAMACGTPSLLSDIAVFRELYGGTARFWDPAAPLGEAIAQALANPVPAGRLLEHASRYTWARTAAATAQVYREVAGP